MTEVEYRPMDLPELILGVVRGWGWTDLCPVQYPVKCGMCGRETKGNWITGYYMPCLQDGTHAE